MSEFKVGDMAWLRGTAIEDHGVIGFMPTFEREYIPDVPNLAAVARVLASEHAEPLVRAIQRAAESAVDWVALLEKWAEDLRILENGVPDLDVIPQESRDLSDKHNAEAVEQRDALLALAAALNGGTA